MLKNEIEKNDNEKALLALTSELVNILLNAKKENQLEKASLLLLKTIEHFNKYNDVLIFKKVFFYRIGNTYLYNKYSMKDYFDNYDIFFSYDVKKDFLKIYGKDNLKNIDKSLKVFLSDRKKEIEKEKNALSESEKIKIKIESKIKSLSEKEIEFLKVYLKDFKKQD